MRVVHVVATAGFAGTERYVMDVAAGQAARGHDVTVLGGDPSRMRQLLPAEVEHVPAPTWWAAARELTRRADIVHAHLTAGELAAVVSRPRTQARVVATRHIAARRGASRIGRLAAPLIERNLHLEIAISEFVRSRIDRPAAVVLPNGVRDSAAERSPGRTILVAQRLEAEKQTEVALRAFAASGLADDGWTLDVCGEGSEREALRTRNFPSVRLLGWQPDVTHRMSAAGALLATAPAEPMGLTVLEAMARGVPVVAADGGGHRETLGADWPGLFPPGDVDAAAARLRDLPDGEPLRARQRALFSLDDHVEKLLVLYDGTPKG